MTISIGKRRLILLGLAFGMAGLAVFLVLVYLKQKAAELEAKYASNTEMGAVVVAGQDISAGTRVKTSIFAIRNMPLDMIPPDAIVPSDIERAEGQSLKIALPYGRPLLWGYLSSGMIPSFSDMLQEDRRALTIAVDELNSISGMIRPGDRIDMFIISKEKDELSTKDAKVVMPLLQDVLVKATGNIVRREVTADGREYDRHYSTLTLDLLPDEIGKVLIAQENGELKAALKRPEQNSANYQPTREIDLWDKGEKVGVTFYIGGKSSGILKSELLPYSKDANEDNIPRNNEIAGGPAIVQQTEETEQPEENEQASTINAASAEQRE